MQDMYISHVLQRIEQNISQAAGDFYNWINGGDDYDDPSWKIEQCFLQLLATTELIGLSELRKMIFSEYSNFKGSKTGFNASKMGPDEPYSLCLSRIRNYFSALVSFFPQEDSKNVSKDLVRILKDTLYVITNKSLFNNAPQNETDIHLRIEGILKCLFVDLKHKPKLTKPIKNFEPDTGIPSMRTLIEYKFLSKLNDATRVADEILADTRGYTSNEWNNFIFVIYETNRFKPETDWKQMLSQSGITDNTELVLLCGEARKSNHIRHSKRKI